MLELSLGMVKRVRLLRSVALMKAISTTTHLIMWRLQRVPLICQVMLLQLRNLALFKAIKLCSSAASSTLMKSVLAALQSPSRTRPLIIGHHSIILIDIMMIVVVLLDNLLRIQAVLSDWSENDSLSVEVHSQVAKPLNLELKDLRAIKIFIFNGNLLLYLQLNQLAPRHLQLVDGILEMLRFVEILLFNSLQLRLV